MEAYKKSLAEHPAPDVSPKPVPAKKQPTTVAAKSPAANKVEPKPPASNGAKTKSKQKTGHSAITWVDARCSTWMVSHVCLCVCVCVCVCVCARSCASAAVL